MGGGVQRARERGRERGALLIGEAAETLSSCRFLSKNKIKKKHKAVCVPETAKQNIFHFSLEATAPGSDMDLWLVSSFSLDHERT